MLKTVVSFFAFSTSLCSLRRRTTFGRCLISAALADDPGGGKLRLICLKPFSYRVELKIFDIYFDTYLIFHNPLRFQLSDHLPKTPVLLIFLRHAVWMLRIDQNQPVRVLLFNVFFVSGRIKSNCSDICRGLTAEQGEFPVSAERLHGVSI